MCQSPAPLTLLSNITLLAAWTVFGVGCTTQGQTEQARPKVAIEEGAEDRVRAMPAPTDPRGEGQDDAEDERRRLREEWIELMHRSGPDVDWRSVEEQNRTNELLRRNALRRSGNPDGPNVSQGTATQAWTELGSSNQAGHTRCCAIGSDQGGMRFLYLGSAGGGLWRTPLGVDAWEPLSDSVFGGVDDVVVLAPEIVDDEDVIVMRRNTSVLRSDDGGQTWLTPAGLNGLSEIRRIITLPDAAQTVMILARGNTGTGTTLGLWASVDQGQTFSLRFGFGGNWSGDIWAPQEGPGAGSDIYVLTAGRLRKSVDAGLSFALLQVLNTGSSEGALTGSEAGGPHLYALLRDGNAWTLHRSNDGGLTSTDLGVIPGYWGGNHSIMAFSDDPWALVYGGVDGMRSSDGGQSFTAINSWTEYYGNPAQKLHADLRGMNSFPHPDLPGQHLGFIHTDGGTFLTTDHGETVQNLCLDGLGVGQFYDTLTSSGDPRLVVGGTQDQGYQRGYVEPPNGPGPSTPFDQLISGDYAHLSSTDGNHTNVYCTFPGFILVQRNEQGTSLAMVDFPAGSNNIFLPPLVADPLDGNGFYYLNENLWRYQLNGATWEPTLHSTQDFLGSSGSFLAAIAFAPSDPQRCYIATNTGRLWHSSDRAVTWTEALNTGPSAHFFHGSSLIVDPNDRDHVLVGGAGYTGPGVRESFDGGVTWQPAAQGLPNTLAFELAWGADGSGDVYAATEAGAWVRRAATGQWENIMGLVAPNTIYWSVESVEAAGVMRFGTHGRGIWDYLIDTEGDDLGLRICSPANPSSSFEPAEIRAEGSVVAGANNLVLTATQLPTNQFGYFLASRNSGLVMNPGGSQGDLCLGGNLVRYVNQVQNSGATGDFQMAVDLTAIPANPLVAVMPGDTWYFQAWFRDFNFLPTSNFTDAIGITFH